jgi:hypothetical protein
MLIINNKIKDIDEKKINQTYDILFYNFKNKKFRFKT